MIVTLWSVKGGSGTSVVAAGLAAAWSGRRRVLAVDLAGDLPAVLGLQTPAGPGVVDWLRAGRGVGAGALHALATEAGDGLRIIHRGGDLAPTDADPTSCGSCAGSAGADRERWRALAEALAAHDVDVVVDAGLAPVPHELAAATDASLLVIRQCFLALRRASTVAAMPTGAVLVAEPGRALGRADVERTLGVRLAGEIRLDPAVSRAVDAGLLLGRMPASVVRLAKDVERWADVAVAAAAQQRLGLGLAELPGHGGDVTAAVASERVWAASAASPSVWEGWQ